MELEGSLGTRTYVLWRRGVKLWLLFDGPGASAANGGGRHNAARFIAVDTFTNRCVFTPLLNRAVNLTDFLYN